MVAPGLYYENINFFGKEIIVTSEFMFSNDTSVINNTIIDGGNNGSVVIFSNWENNNTILNGISIRNGNATGEYPDYFGGGIRCLYANPTLSNLKVYSNNANYGGGGIACLHSSAILKNIEVFDNVASYDGGGIELFYGTTTLDNILVYGNTANSGGGIWNKDNYTTIRNSTICFNDGGGIRMYDSDLSIHNSNVTDNIGLAGIFVVFGEGPLVNYSNIWGNEGGNFYQCNPLFGINITVNANSDSCDAFYNIQLNPQYVNSMNDNFRILGTSPCIDAGSNTYVFGMFDLDGNARISNGNHINDTIVDIGAYEYTCDSFNIVQQPNSIAECEGENVAFEILTEGDAPYYQWQKDGTNISGATYSTYIINNIILADSGEYRCKVWSICDTSYSDNGTLSISPLPIVNITATPSDTVCITQTIILDAGNPGSTFEWSTGEITQQIEVENESGFEGGLQTYWTTVKDINNCQATNNIDVYFDPCTGYSENTNNFVFEIFPNPARESVRIKISGLKTKSKISLTNRYGEILKTEMVNDISGKYFGELDLSNYPKGIYFLKIHGEIGEIILVEKFVKI